MKKLLIILLIISSSLQAQIRDSIFYNFGNVDAAGWNTVRYNADTVFQGYRINVYSAWFKSNGIDIPELPTNVAKTSVFNSSGNDLNITLTPSTNDPAPYLKAKVYMSEDTVSQKQRYTFNGLLIDSIEYAGNTTILHIPAMRYGGGKFEIKIAGTSDRKHCLINAMVLYPFDSVGSYDYSRVVDTLVTPNPTTEAVNLYTWLKDDVYGKRILSGHTGQSSEGRYWEMASKARRGGKIYAVDLNTTTSGYAYYYDGVKHTFGAVDNRQFDSAYYHYNELNNIIAIQIHWYAPSGSHGTSDTTGARGEVAQSNTFSTAPPPLTLYDPILAATVGTDEYNWLMNDIDNYIVPYLQRFKDANIPVLFRPFHEATGSWFWWGEDKQAFLDLWAILFDRLANHHNMNNLIWVDGTAFPEMDWHVPDNMVDIVGYDNYPNHFDYSVNTFRTNFLRTAYDHKKMVALPETGPIPYVDSMIYHDALPIYIVTWGNESVEGQNDSLHIATQYQHPLIINAFDYDSLINAPEPAGVKFNLTSGLNDSSWIPIIGNSSVDSLGITATASGWTGNSTTGALGNGLPENTSYTNLYTNTSGTFTLEHMPDSVKLFLFMSRDLASGRTQLVYINGVQVDSLDAGSNKAEREYVVHAVDSTVTIQIQEVNNSNLAYLNAVRFEYFEVDTAPEPPLPTEGDTTLISFGMYGAHNWPSVMTDDDVTIDSIQVLTSGFASQFNAGDTSPNIPDSSSSTYIYTSAADSRGTVILKNIGNPVDLMMFCSRASVVDRNQNVYINNVLVDSYDVGGNNEEKLYTNIQPIGDSIVIEVEEDNANNFAYINAMRIITTGDEPEPEPTISSISVRVSVGGGVRIVNGSILGY